MNTALSRLLAAHSDLFKFLCVGGSASAVHAVISWVFYYHIWSGQTILSTLVGYTGGWLVSYIGNRLWSFRTQAQNTPHVATLIRFVIGQFTTMFVLLSSTWVFQQLLVLYFHWYILTNGVIRTPELAFFCAGASYPPALVAGMGISALISYLIMKKMVFRAPK